MRILTTSTKLPEFSLPLKVESAEERLDLRTSLIHEDDKRGLLKFISKIPTGIEKIIAKPILLKFKAYLPDYKFRSDYLNDDNFHILVDQLKDFLYINLEKDIQKNNSDSQLQFKMQQMTLKSKALLSVIDDLYFRPRSSKEAISADLRKLFICAHNAARDELIHAKNLLSQDDPHLALSRFERSTGRTPHYNLEMPNSFDKPLQAFMPVRTEELNWQNQSLNVLKELFQLDDKKALSIVKYLSMFSDDKLDIEGFARIATRQPYLNLSGNILDQSIFTELDDPDLENMPLSTVVHEITHVLLKDRYSDLFKFKTGLQTEASAVNKSFELTLGNQKVSFPLHYIEELICFALTIHINPLTTVLKLASIKDGTGVSENYAAAAAFGKSLYSKYNLADLNSRPQTLEKIRTEGLDMARTCIALLDSKFLN